MNIKEIKKIKDCKDLIGTKPTKEQYTDLITEPTLFTSEGKVVAVYDKIGEKFANAAKIISTTTKANQSKRQYSGVPTISSVFGSIPKNGVRVPSCRGTVRNKQEKHNFFLITEIARELSEKYKKVLPEQYSKVCRLQLLTQIKTN